MADTEVAAALPRLRDEEVRARLDRLEDLLALVEKTPGPSGELALSAVTELAQVYGEALARVVDHAASAGATELLSAYTGDELIGHLLVLHGVHPEPVESRVARAVDEVQPAVVEHGGRLALRGIEDGVATVELTVGGCGSSGQGLRDAVREAVLCVAPELNDVNIASSRPAAQPAFVPLTTLSKADPAHAGGVSS